MLLDRVQLCEAFGVSDSAISAWEKKGMPVVRKGRGRGQKSLYDFDKVSAWCQQTGAGLNVQALVARNAKAIERSAAELGVRLAGAREARELAHRIALARVTFLERLPSWDFAMPPQELAEAIDLYVDTLICGLERGGFPGISAVLEESSSDAAWPASLEEIVARARSEVPTLNERTVQ